MKKILGILLIFHFAMAQDEFSGIQINCPSARKSAPPVNKAYIVRVISHQGGYENIQQDQKATHRQHSSQGLKVITAVCGYGGAQRDILTYGGSSIQYTAQKDIDSNHDGIVDGFLISWDMEGKSIGATVYYEAISANDGSKQKIIKLQIR